MKSPQLVVPRHAVATHRLAIVIGFMLTIALSPLAAQTSAYVAHKQPSAILPGELSGLSVVDSHIYAFMDRLLMVSKQYDGQIQGFAPDTLASKLSSDVKFLIRRPGVNVYYYTATDRKGIASLYYAYHDGRRFKSKRIDLGAFDIQTPTLSDDGNIIIFSSRNKEQGHGGYDLWYSRRTSDGWSRPVNLGDRINSAGDEITPFFWNNYLFFASNGRDESKGRLNIYATQIINDGIVNDSAGMLQFGRGRVQRLPEPFNTTAADCSNLVIDTLQHTAYWLVGNNLMSYTGPMHGNTVWGTVTDEQGQPLPKVAVAAVDDWRIICSTTTDRQGRYSICLPTDSEYNIVYQTNGRFAQQTVFRSKPDRTGLLFGDVHQDATLEGIPIGQPIAYYDLFNPGASVELSERGTETLNRIVQFLSDNPTLIATLSLSSDLLIDAEYNALLSAKRLQVIDEYISPLIPKSVELRLINRCEGSEGCSDATGNCTLVLLLE